MSPSEADALPAEARALVARFAMQRHVEGGYFCETYRAPRGPGEARAASTAIYFLLAAGQVSRLHRLTSDEVWHFYLGDPLCVVELQAGGPARVTTLGRDLAAGQALQHVVPAETWFGAFPAPKTSFAFVGCTVAPGFEFSDFELGAQAPLLAAFPAARAEILRLTRA
jgi:predicted cupin superfamily sugar epimerase